MHVLSVVHCPWRPCAVDVLSIVPGDLVTWMCCSLSIVPGDLVLWMCCSLSLESL